MAHIQTASSIDIVVVDDEESIREGCRQTLEGEGYRAMVAKDGLQGIRIVEEAKPRVVLLDLSMPNMGGLEMLERLPGIDPRIVPIIITGYGTVDSAVASMKLGAFDFIAKPFDMDQLLDVVNRGMSRWDNLAPVATTAQPNPKPMPSPRDLTEADVLLGGLEVLEQYQSLGLNAQSLASKLANLEAEANHHANRLGQIREAEKAVGSLVADLKLVDGIIAKHDYKKNALIQILLDIQASKRWLPRHLLLWTSRRLGVPLARIYSVASFYEAFSLVPQGAHTVQVCTGTACHVRKAPALLSMVSSLLGIKPGETDAKMQFTLKTVNCLGCCALAPVMKVDDSYYGDPSLKEIKAVFKSLETSEGTNA